MDGDAGDVYRPADAGVFRRAFNILNASGELLRDIERDAINDWLTESKFL